MVSEIQQVQNQPTAAYRHTNCCGNFVKILPENYRKPCFAVGIILLLNGAISLIIGIVGFFTTSQYVYHYQSNYAFYYHNATVFTGANIWAGIFVSALTMLSHKY